MKMGEQFSSKRLGSVKTGKRWLSRLILNLPNKFLSVDVFSVAARTGNGLALPGTFWGVVSFSGALINFQLCMKF